MYKRGIKVIVMALLLTVLAVTVSFGEEVEPVYLQLNGKNITTDVNPILVNNRMLLPARALFEGMGGTTDWDENSRQVTVSLNGSSVVLTIDSKTALVNGTAATMDVPAQIVGDRTLIPARFVSENLNCRVAWDENTRVANIIYGGSDTAAATQSPIITGVSAVKNGDNLRVTVKADGPLDENTAFSLENPYRWGVDIKGAVLWEEGSVNGDGTLVSSVRYAQYEESTVRVVADLSAKATGTVSWSADKTELYFDFNLNTQTALPADPVTPKPTLPSTGTSSDGLPMLAESMRDKIIFIDAGHGGTDPGSQGKQNGAVVLNEKDLNLDIAKRLNQYLINAGATTVMIRTDDTSIPTKERGGIANGKNADLYISVHNNSSTSTSPNGTEVHYANKEGQMDKYGYTSKTVADAIYKNLMSELNLNGRGVKESPNYLVIKHSNMPSLIIEGAFLSNASDLAFMLTDEYRQKYAYGSAKGIIEALNAAAGS